ncbi:MAG: hypothetical protein PHH75_05560 [Candidatus Omnitrophica bacterium]|nr:hypothetical protein [Candidatus Omnitrophota bacterium]MDD5574628.1 hypothetical protein [Candidatus Omnitrophota bacterium]
MPSKSCCKTIPGISSLKRKCARIHAKIAYLQAAMEKVHAKNAANLAWRGLLKNAVKGMDAALDDLEDRLEHIRAEIREILPLIIVFFLSVSVLTGCAHLKEGAKTVWGTSISHLEKARAKAKIVVVKTGRPEAFEWSMNLLRAQGANVYMTGPDKEYLAAMNFAGYVNTTQVGLFFTPVDPATTKIEVASLSPWLAQDVAVLLSNANTFDRKTGT